MARGQVSEQFEDVVYDYRVVSGQSILQVSGAVKLHSVVYDRMVSGAVMTIFDSAISGRYLSAGASVIGLPYCGAVMEPVQVNYDIRLNSGLVIVASGTVNVTALYK